MLIKLPGGHYVNPSQIDSITHAREGDDFLIYLLFKSREIMLVNRISLIPDAYIDKTIALVETFIDKIAQIINSAPRNDS